MPVISYRELPDIPTGYALDDVWSVVIPIARTNLVINPSFETNTTSWTAIGGSIARSTTQQYHGAYSLAITPTATTTDGARFDTVSLTSGTTYAYSAKVRGVAGLQYSLNVETTGGVALATKTFLATGRWQWVIGYYTETATTTRRVTARKNGHTSVAIFYLDGVQVEAIVAGELASTYIDGDQLGLVPNQNPVPYYWTGTPHASTSVRSALTRAGGMVIPFKRYGFILVAMIGLGIAAPQNTSFEYARADGGYDDYTRKPSDQFTLSGRFQGRTYAELRRNRSGLGQYFDRDLVAQDQRLTLLHHVEDRNGNTISSEARILAKYVSGFEGNTDNQHAETVPITFQQYLPVALADGESGVALSVQQSIANANYVIQRSPAGVWSAMGTGVSGGTGFGTGNGIGAVGLDGNVYIGGFFTAMGGVANTLHIARWDPIAQTWNAMGTGATGLAVLCIAVAPDGQIIAAGDIATGFGGVANTAHLARWTGSAWQSITAAGSANGAVRAVAFDSLGNLYAGGGFTTINGVAANRIAKMTPAGVWSALSTGLSTNEADSLAIATNNDVYIGGQFAGPFADLTKWNGAAFSSVGGSPNGLPNALLFASNGNLYMVGAFTTINSIAMAGVARWNGVQWNALSSGFGGASPFGVSEIFDVTGSLLYIGGTFSTAGGITPPDGFVIWNGSTFVYPDVDLPGTPTVSLLLRGRDGALYAGFTTSGTATAAGVTTLTNPGTARAYPTITITGPTGTAARIFSIVNTTTNRAIYLNLSMNVGEKATLVFKPDQLSFTSTFQGNIASTILPGSNMADFFLAPGANTITFFSADSTVTATLFYRPAYLSIDDVP